ncbi:MAG TPA: acyl-CoA dehydrogenase family protein [Acidimicrobiia bacterium]|jgi:alkylation response protein AidB-like acyl-CoA dehydrogenase
MAQLHALPTSDVRESLAALSPLIEAHAGRSDGAGHLVDPVADALLESGAFALMVPAVLGGAEADPVTALDVVAEISRLDGSVGWNLMAVVTSTALAGAFLGDDAVQEMFAVAGNPLCAGQMAPRGMAVRRDGGYVVKGRFGFASGSRHAGWIFGGFREVTDDGPVLLESGLPSVLAGVVPREAATMLGNWDVLGLEGTGSYDYEIPEYWLAEGFAFSFFDPVPRRGGPVYRLGPLGIAAVGHAGFALGVGRRALAEIGHLALTKKRIGQAVLVDQQAFQRDYGSVAARLEAAAAYCRATFDDAYRAAEADEVTLEVRARCRLATLNAHAAALAAADFAYHEAGSDSLRTGSAIQRCFRNLRAATQHVFVDDTIYADSARVLLGVAEPELVL